MKAGTAVTVCAVCGLLHLVPPIALGWTDGDHSMLAVGGPLAGSTVLAAAALQAGGRVGRLVALLLTAVVATLSFLLVVAYGYGFLHLPQAVVALVAVAVVRPLDAAP